MKISKLISELDAARELIGDVEVCTTGYYDTLGIDEVQMTTWGEQGRFLDGDCECPDQTHIAVLLPGNCP
jgi:hypothetical protein